MYKNLLAIDPSLTCSGWALFSIKSGSLLGVGNIRSLPPSHTMAERLQDLQKQVSKMQALVELGENDVLVCEAATAMVDPRAAMILEQIRGMYEALARERGATVPGRANPRSVQRDVMGINGRQIARPKVKDLAVHTAIHLFGEKLEKIGFKADLKNLKRNQDITDALLVGYFALTKIQAANQLGVGLDVIFEEQKRYNSRVLKKVLLR